MRPVIVLNDTRGDRHFGCTAVMRALEAGLDGAGLQPRLLLGTHEDWRKHAGFERALAAARLVVVNGEGTLHHDRPLGLRLLQVAAAARAAGVPSALVNAGWQANGEAYAAAARQFDLVSARDSRSAAELRAAGIACRVVPDLSLCTATPPAAPRAGIGVTDSVDRDVALLLSRLRRGLGATTVSIHERPRGLRGRWRFQRAILGKRDLASPLGAWRRLSARREQLGASGESLEGFVAGLAGLALLVSGRFHACTLALVAGTPFLAAGTNSHKISALVEDAGLAPWRAAPALDAAAINEAMHGGWSAAEQAARADYVARARQEARELFSDLGQLAA